MEKFKNLVESASLIEKYISLKNYSEQEKWILKNIYPYNKMKPRKTKNGFNVTPRKGVIWMIEFADGVGHSYPEDFGIKEDELGRVITYPQAFFVYDKKFGEPIREVWLEDFFEELLTQHERGY
jgi:hypothetical protein